MIYRSLIRKLIAIHLFRVINDEEEDQYGHSEILEIVNSFAIGFGVPLKGEHKIFYQ